MARARAVEAISTVNSAPRRSLALRAAPGFAMVGEAAIHNRSKTVQYLVSRFGEPADASRDHPDLDRYIESSARP